MAKRANPYVEDFIPQSKVHVGLKQFNNSEDRLKNVYEKTLELLFKGAKNFPLNNNTLNSEVSFDTGKDNMRQLFIGKNGKLLHSGSLVKSPAVKNCSCSSCEIETTCAYCEESLCSSCLHPCSTCQHSYCSRCSLSGPDGTEYCISCYS